MKISDDQIQAAYAVASDVFDGTMTTQDGVQILHVKHGLNEASAHDLITIFRSMMIGNVYHRTLSIPATHHYLGRIKAERGELALANAIEATRKHLDYYENLPNGGKQPTKRKIIQLYSARPTGLQDLEILNEEFARKVEEATADSQTTRQARLKIAAPSPAMIKATTEIYVRNPDVVAEVLFQAQGLCGNCGQAAPFLRRKDGTPYLEVHHKKPLKSGGDDTVENSIALCPNCHRREHHGLPD
jgi:5-methylcytosine-specific restriction protein A